MNLELNKSTGNLFINKSEFFFNNEQFISNNIFLKKHNKKIIKFFIRYKNILIFMVF